jgi:hypothetical protein
MLSHLLKTKARRAFAVTLLALTCVAIVTAFATKQFIEPSRWYFFTTDGSQIDVQSPNRRLIIDVDLYPQGTEPAYLEMRQRLRQRCDLSLREARLRGPVGVTYRGVELCNAFDAAGDEFESRHLYFRSRVDSLYQRYYGELIAHFSKYLGAAIGLWLTLLIAWGTIKWISKGT